MDKLNRIIKPIGYLVTALSLAYLVSILLHFDLSALQVRNPLWSLLVVLLFGVWASLFIVIGAYSWKLILEFVGGTRLPTGDVFRVYLKSNIAKYLPGNVMHYAGRNYLGYQLGWKNEEMAFSSLLEYLFGSGFTGIIIVILIAVGLITVPAQVPLSIDFGKVLGYSALGAAGLLVLIYAYRYAVNREGIRITSAKLRNRAGRFFTLDFLVLFAKIFLISAACFVLNCFFYFYLCDLALDFRIRPADFFNANAALSIANYMSILTPGVPAGLGVKESVSILLISAYGYPKESLVMSIVVFRIACVLGDVFPYFLVMLYGKAGRE